MAEDLMENKELFEQLELLFVPAEDELIEARRNYIKLQNENMSNISNWYHKIAAIKSDVVKVPKTVIVNMPEEYLEGFFREAEDKIELSRTWVETVLYPVAKELANEDGIVFIKNGIFSGKFDYDNSCRCNVNDIEKFVENIFNLQEMSLCFDTFGNLEFAVREYIPSTGNAAIYNGMQLRNEVRVFYDFTLGQYKYDVDYWLWSECHDRICEDEQDKQTYESIYSSLHSKTLELIEKHRPEIEKALSQVEMDGIWSVDFILEDNKVWLIDMGEGARSYYYDETRL